MAHADASVDSKHWKASHLTLFNVLIEDVDCDTFLGASTNGQQTLQLELPPSLRDSRIVQAEATAFDLSTDFLEVSNEESSFFRLVDLSTGSYETATDLVSRLLSLLEFEGLHARHHTLLVRDRGYPFTMSGVEVIGLPSLTVIEEREGRFILPLFFFQAENVRVRLDLVLCL